VAALAGFVSWERRTSDPLLPIQFFRSRAFSASNAAVFLLFGSALAGLFFYSQVLQIVMHYGPLATGIRLSPWTVTVFFFAPVAGLLVSRVGERPLVAAGLLLQGVASAWFAVIADPAMSYGSMIPPFVISGIGISIAMPALMTAVFGSVPDSGIGTASGTFSVMRQLGSAFGIALAVAVFAAVGGYGSVQDFSDGFAAASATAAVVALIGVPVGLALPGRRRTAESETLTAA
jgi:MFS family permease